MSGNAKFHKVRVVNPAEEPKRKKKTMPGKKRATTSKPKRTTNPRRRRRRRSTSRRRRRNPGAPMGAPRRSSRRRRNPDNGGSRSVDIMAPLRNWRPFYRLLGKMAGAFAVRKWGDPEGAVPSTATMGGRWTIRNHFINLAAGFVAGSLFTRIIKRGNGQEVYEGAVDLSVSKAFWHEVIQAIPGGATYFGSAEVQQLLARAQAGDTIDDGRGNRYVVQVSPDGGKQMVPMMGLQPATALDGLQPARPIDGIQVARPIDGWQTRQRMGMGHLTVDPTNDNAAYIRRGTSDPYLAAFLGTRR